MPTHNARIQTGLMMAGAFTKSDWRRAVGLIAAYAFALNVMLTGFAAHAAPSLDPFSVICLSAASGGDHAAATGNDGKGTAPVHHDCGNCTLCGVAPSALPSFQVLLNLQFIVRSSIVADATRRQAVEIKSLPGQPRAPPQTA